MSEQKSAFKPPSRSLSLEDLPPADTIRWVASRKSIVVRAVAQGLLPQSEALQRYGLSEEEFDLWRLAIESHGDAGLKITQLQKFR